MKRSGLAATKTIVAIIILAIIYVVTLAFQSNKTVSIKDNTQASPIIIDLYLEEGEISPLLEGVIESGNVFADDMQEMFDPVTVDSPWQRVKVEKGLVFRLRSIQVRYDWFYQLYPEYSDFCMQKLSIRPSTEISNGYLVSAPPGSLDVVERYELKNGKIESVLDVELYREYKGDACPTPSGTILYSDETIGRLGLIPLYAYRNSYYYPFDQQLLSFEIWTELSMKNSKGEEGIAVITPEIKLTPLLSNWRVNATVNNNTEGTDFPGDLLTPHMYNVFARTTVDVKMSRPFITQSLLMIILVISLVAILSLVVLKDQGGAIGTALTIVLGLWSTQTFLIPNSVNGFTIIAPLIFTLYGILAIVLLVRFTFIFPILRTNSGKSTEDITSPKKTPSPEKKGSKRGRDHDKKKQ